MRAVPFVVAASLALASPAFAQAAGKMKLEVTRAELQIIGQGLMELPYKTSAAVLNDLQAQLAEADRAAAAKTKADKPAAPKKPVN